jgi:transposase-like protein
MTDKDKKDREQKKKRGHRHLTPLEIITIAEAYKRGEKVSSLATQFGVSRQTIYNAIKAIKEARVSKEGSTAKITSNKRKRTTRIPEEIRTELVKLKKKYPSWGVEYLRKRWIEMGKRPLAKSTMYKILKNAGLMKPIEKGTTGYSRFEMIKPGQLYQMDIQGKLYLKGIGWVHGFAIIDDYSRFVPAMRYYPDMRISNAILTLDRAIREYGIPEAIYLDNGVNLNLEGNALIISSFFAKPITFELSPLRLIDRKGRERLNAFLGR